jgi:hypothetical protein
MHLRAQMPAARITSRGLMELRIARKVAALSGIPGPPEGSDDAGRGRAWMSEYRLLTTTELTLGGPVTEQTGADAGADGGVFVRDGRRFSHIDGQQVDVMPIPNVALRDYGPDTKAALVLTGVNKVLEPVTAAVTDALADIRKQIDAPILLVAVAQCLLQEVFAAQPVLVLNGIQASQAQRALMLADRVVQRPDAAGRVLARVEYGNDRPAPPHHPMNLELVYDLWDSLVEKPDQWAPSSATERYLRMKPLFGYEQNDIVAVAGTAQVGDRLVSALRDASESSLTGSVPGAPQSTVWVLDPPDRPSYVEVTVPRQRQIELILANVAPALSPRLLAEPLVPGQVLALPELDVARWRGTSLLHRRAVLLAHYYAIRAAGWISGMTKFNHRRNRDDAAARCAALVEAADLLLAADDPLRDQVVAFGLGYQMQHDASLGLDNGLYPKLVETLDAIVRRDDAGQPGRAVLIEILPLVLDQLRTVRRAVSLGVCATPTEQRLTEDLQRWWRVARERRDTLITDPDERRFLDSTYAGILLDHSCDDASIRDGLELIADALRTRQDAARRDVRWTAVRTSYLIYLRGLSIALERRLDPDQLADWAATAYDVAHELRDHGETHRFLQQRTDRSGTISYDGLVVLLLVTLADGWVSVARSGALDPERHEDAVKCADWAVQEIRTYLDTVRGSGADMPGTTSQLDPLRVAMAEDVLRRWDAQDG